MQSGRAEEDGQSAMFTSVACLGLGMYAIEEDGEWDESATA